MFLIDDILLSPAKALMFVFKEIHKRVMDEYYSEDKIYQELNRLQYLLDIGEISEKKYNKFEELLMKRLQEIEDYKESLEEEGWDEESE